jgi:hypothetical protein
MRLAKWFIAMALPLVMSSSIAQDVPFPDVPENRWVFSALKDMQECGLLTHELPDQLRRRDIAKATLATVIEIDSMISGLQLEIDALGTTHGAGESTINLIREGLDRLRKRVNQLSELTTEKRMRMLICLSFAFERELTGLGIEVTTMRKEIVNWVPRYCTFPKVIEEKATGQASEPCSICNVKHEHQLNR